MTDTADNRRKWIEALRSGEYEQGYGGLRVKDTYCCLGVACDVYRKETGEGKWGDTLELGTPYREFKVAHGSGNPSGLPFPVRDWLGLSDGGGAYGPEWSEALWKHNDADHYDFDQIADVIEAEPEGLLS